MRSQLIRLPLGLVFCSSLALGLAAGCGEKASTPTGDAGTPKTKPSDDDDSGSGSTHRTSGSTSGSGTGTIGDDDDTTTTGGGAYDVCAEATKNSTVAASKLLPKLCGSGVLKGLAVFDGTSNAIAPTLDYPAASAGGAPLTVEAAGATLAQGDAADIFKMNKMQVNNSKGFKAAAFQFDPDSTLTILAASADSPTYHYDNSTTDGAIAYDAKTTFIVLKEGTAYAQVTEKLAKAPADERVVKFSGLTLIVKKAAGESYTYAATSQEYFEPSAANVKNLGARVKNGMIKEQMNAWQNAKDAKAKAK